MPDFDRALSLTGDIYDAAIDPSLWPEVLRKLCEFLGSAASGLNSHDVAAGTCRFHFSWGDDPHFTRLYLEKYINLNPHLVSLMMLDVGEVGQASRMMPIEKFRNTRFYNEWARPAGYGDLTVAMIEKSANIVTFLSAPHRDCESPVGAVPRRRMEMLVPHVRRAVAIGNVIAMHKIDASVLSDAVDALSAGVFMVAEDGRMIRANESGQAMLKAGDMLVLDRGVLAARGSAAVRQALRDAIAEATGGGVIVNPRGVAIPLVSRSGDHHVAHVLPLTSGARRKAALAAPAAVAAVFVHDTAVGGLLPLEAVAQQFQLSAAELRVLVAVVEVGGNIAEIASVVGISEPTVKTHLRRLFEKTGAQRQTDFIRLVAGYSNPLIRSSDPTRRPALEESSFRMM